MRGVDETSGSLFGHVDISARIPAAHPLRPIRRVVKDALIGLDAGFEGLYAALGRPSIPPDRLLTTDMARKVMAAILAHREVAPLLSDEHFSVDGTDINAWACVKSFQSKETDTPPADEPPEDPPTTGEGADPAVRTEPVPSADPPQDIPDQAALDARPAQPASETETAPMPGPRHRKAEVAVRGRKRSNAAHAPTTDPDARLFRAVRRVSAGPGGARARRTGTGALLCYTSGLDL